MSVGKGLSSRLRERVVLMDENKVDNGRGGRKVPDGQPAWKPISGEIPAEVLPLRGGEALVRGVERSSQIYRVTIRNRDDVTTGKRLLWRGLLLDIRTAPPCTDRTTIIMTCESGKA